MSVDEKGPGIVPTDDEGWHQFMPPPRSRIATGLPVFCEDDCTVTANEVMGHPGKFVANLGDLITLHGSLDTLVRIAAEMAAAVEALRPEALPMEVAG